MAKTICYYILARYMPDPFRGEFVNFGIVLQSSSLEFVGSKFLNDYSRLREFDPAVHELVLDDFSAVSRGKVHAVSATAMDMQADHASGPPEFIGQLSRSYSGLVQFSKPKAVLTEDPADELSRLYEELVSPPVRNRPAVLKTSEQAVNTLVKSTPKYTLASLRREVVNRLLDSPQLHQRIQRRYEVKGSVNSWIFDAGFRDGAIHVVQALSFDVETAEAKQNRALILKAKVDDARMANYDVIINAYAVVLRPSENSDGYKECVKLLNASDIQTREPDQLNEVVSELTKKVAVH